ncbi:MAG: class II glutamine amidotransferase [Polyangiaceae bacterium]
MCRLLGIVSSEPTDYRIVLREAPRSLATLSQEHRDGWGIAVCDLDGPWALEKGVLRACDDERFHEIAAGRRGNMLLAHVRLKTVGETSLANTHPFESDGWVFAHNGTIKNLEQLERLCSAERLRAVQGHTDSERLFAAILTRLDVAGVDARSSDGEVVPVLTEFFRELRSLKDAGTFNGLLSNGRTLYAHRFGRSLYVLRRGHGDSIMPVRVASDGTRVETPWSGRRKAILIASEALTDEPWFEIEDGTLLRAALGNEPTLDWLDSPSS